MLIISESFVAASKGKGKKPKNNRSAFLSQLMKTLGGDTGNEVANAFMDTDRVTFVEKMNAVTKQLAKKMPNANASKEAHASDVSESARRITASLLLSTMYGSHHGGMQKVSSIEGADVLWNFVKIQDKKYVTVGTREEATGIACNNKYYPFKA